MSIARNAEFDSSVSNTLKEKDGVISDAADAIALDASGSVSYTHLTLPTKA